MKLQYRGGPDQFSVTGRLDQSRGLFPIYFTPMSSFMPSCMSGDILHVG